jgi:uncharacterized membrane protein YqaE (UPF0057 family)
MTPSYRNLHILNYNLQGDSRILQIPVSQKYFRIHGIVGNRQHIRIRYNCTNYRADCSILLDSSSIIQIIPIVRGGSIMDDVIDNILSMLEPLVSPVMAIANVFVILLKILTGLIKLIVWLIQFFLWFLIDFCNPLNLATDFIGGITKITRLLFAVMSDAFFGALKFFFNMFITPIFSGFWGWDSVLTEKEKTDIYNKEAKEKQNPNGLVESSCHGPNVKCFRTPDGQVPFTVILATILLPPMGLFMEFGLTSWINIVICGILTMVYYFPGLIYALILIYAS